MPGLTGDVLFCSNRIPRPTWHNDYHCKQYNLCRLLFTVIVVTSCGSIRSLPVPILPWSSAFAALPVPILPWSSAFAALPVPILPWSSAFAALALHVCARVVAMCAFCKGIHSGGTHQHAHTSLKCPPLTFIVSNILVKDMSFCFLSESSFWPFRCYITFKSLIQWLHARQRQKMMDPEDPSLPQLSSRARRARYMYCMVDPSSFKNWQGWTTFLWSSVFQLPAYYS